jgi:hypothetical protein
MTVVCQQEKVEQMYILKAIRIKIMNHTTIPRYFHLSYCFLIGASSLKISVAQLANMHKKLIWDPAIQLSPF